jgi:hypothetical protein
MEGNTTTLRIAWSLAEISVLTGLSLGYLRNEQRSGRLAIKKFGRRVVVLDEDLRAYLTRGSEKGVGNKLRQDGQHETI